MKSSVEVRELYKNFSGKEALSHVSFRVKEGEICGLLGHNGAGKSTTLGILLGMVAPNSGEAFLNGISVQKYKTRALRQVGSIFEHPAFYEYLSGWQNLKLLTQYSGRFDRAATEKMVERVGLTKRIHSKVRTYSHGMRQRLALAQALLPLPKILLLDEPTDGLDPDGIRWFREFVLDLRKRHNMTVVFNSHLLSEVEQMCDQIVILRQGKKVFDDSLSRLQPETATYQVALQPWERATKFLRLQGCKVLGNDEILLPPGTDPAVLVAALVGIGVRVSAFAPKPRVLEDFYISLNQ